MLLIILRFLYFALCASVIGTYMQSSPETTPDFINQYPISSFCVMLLITQIATIVDWMIPRKRIEVISAAYFGLLVGVLLSYLLIQAFSNVITADSKGYAIMVMMVLLVMPFICISLIVQTKDDFRLVIPYVEFARDLKGHRPLLVDSSSLIDGRIADVVETGILTCQLIVPQFIIEEIQNVADSTDKSRKTRGRRGLEVLEQIQLSTQVEVKVQDERSTEDTKSVDQRLVVMAKRLGAGGITNDFNLNKAASVQGIDVVNLNDVANSLKPRYIPGERLQIKVMKEGESNGQGVGYLDDGTMVVCENADHLIGKNLSVTVTSVLQSSAGRMIFGKPAAS